MDRTQQLKDAHPWLSYDEVVKVSSKKKFRNPDYVNKVKVLEEFLYKNLIIS